MSSILIFNTFKNISEYLLLFHLGFSRAFIMALGMVSDKKIVYSLQKQTSIKKKIALTGRIVNCREKLTDPFHNANLRTSMLLGWRKQLEEATDTGLPLIFMTLPIKQTQFYYYLLCDSISFAILFCNSHQKVNIFPCYLV